MVQGLPFHPLIYNPNRVSDEDSSTAPKHMW